MEEHIIVCEICGQEVDEENVVEHDDYCYCESCFDDNFGTCDICDETVELEELQEVGSKGICPSCLRENYSLCYHCEEYERDENTFEVDGYYYCEDCYSMLFVYCYECEETISRDSAYIYNDEFYCSSCYDEIDFNIIHNYNYKPSSPRRLAAGRLYLGVELEIEATSDNKHEMAEHVVSKFSNNEETFYLKDDGSLDDGFEIVSHPFVLSEHQAENTVPWKDLCEYLSQRGAKSHDVGTCGLHVHASRSFLNANDERRLELFIQYNPDRIKTFARRYSDRWAKNEKSASKVNVFNRNHDRYRALNWCNDNTVEFRMFRGTLRAETVLASIEFASAACRFAKTASSVRLIKPDTAWSDFLTFVKQEGKKYRNLRAYLQTKGLHVLPSTSEGETAEI